MEFDFELADDILWQVDLLNEVFKRLGVPLLFGNTDFVVDEGSAGTFGLHIVLKRKSKNVIPVDIFLEMDEFRLEVGLVDHSFSWLLNELITSKEYVIDLMVRVFSHELMVEHYSFRSNLYLLKPDGTVLDRFTIRNFLFLHKIWRGQRRVETFQPIYKVMSDKS